MGKYLWGLLLVVTCSLLAYTPALAAPDRMDDVIPDAAPDQPGAFAFSWSHLAVDLEGPLNNERTAHDLFKLRYTFNPKVALAFRYGNHDLSGEEGMGLMTPLFNGMDSAQSYGVDLGLNLQYAPTVYPDAAKNIAFAAGSSFGLGLAGTMYKLDQGPLSQNETLVNAYLVYSTDISADMRAHTYFSTGRLSGDSFTGSVNRVGAGLDYALISGRRPLTLMVNGLFDVYNFRAPSFTTNRISRFDVGLRYRVAKDWYTSLGWASFNDSESDQSGSGIFANINYVQQPPDRKLPECPPPAAPAEAPATPPPSADATAPGSGPQLAAAALEPKLMASAAPASGKPAGQSGLRGETEPSQPVSRGASSAGDDAAAAPSPEAPAPAEQPGADEESGIAIPPFPEPLPQHTGSGDVMVRPGVAIPAAAPAAPEKTPEVAPEAPAEEASAAALEVPAVSDAPVEAPVEPALQPSLEPAPEQAAEPAAPAEPAAAAATEQPASGGAGLGTLVAAALNGRPLPASPRAQAFADAGRRSASYFATVPAGYLARQQSIRPASNGIISARSAVLAPSSTEPGGSDDSHAARFSQAAQQVFKTVTHRH